MSRRDLRGAMLFTGLLCTIACASSRSAAPPRGGAAPPAAPAPPAAAGAPGASAPAAAEPPAPAARPEVAPAPPAETPEAAARRRREKGPCSEPRARSEQMVDRARRLLYETLCGASLWFDGLFGEHSHVEAARGASGRLELSMLRSQYEGTEPRVNFNVRVSIPNLDSRVSAFLGRDDRDDFIRDRREGFALSSQFVGLESRERWLAGFGYSLPGSYRQRVGFNVGVHGGRQPEIFAQGRYRRNMEASEVDLWHFRQTVFWTNRDGFGTTSSLDYDHLFSTTLLLRWGSVGTFSESTHGADWRSAVIVYKNLPGSRALAAEAFARGETSLEVPLREYGSRLVYRQNLLGRKWLFGELVVGYSWPRERRDEPRQGSLTVGAGLELLIGHRPYS